MSCNKPAKTYLDQLQILRSRGLLVTNEDQALHCLEHHNYYRLSAYRFPLTVQGNPDQFLPDTTFDDLWNLYHFDRTLRQFVSEAVKRVEISVRARWAYVLGHTLKSLLEHCVYVRNLCAHHARLWNRKFTVRVQLPQSSPASVLPNLHRAEDRRLYNTLVLLIHMVGVIEPAAHWPKRLTQLLLTLKPEFLPHMGFPADWQQRPLWKQLLATP